MSSFWKRSGTDILLFLSIFLFPWWIPLALLIIFLFVFPFFAELLLFGAILDALYASGENFLSSHPFFIGFFALFLVSFWVKERVIYFQRS
ncbi:hypothetical protein EPN83_02380 [Patescibacteria group bacterium]|nr:MAG: hypothetical protein EPN83_02380 [Patescibacteria group bacterium]